MRQVKGGERVLPGTENEGAAGAGPCRPGGRRWAARLLTTPEHPIRPVRITLIANVPRPEVVAELQAWVDGARAAGHEVRPLLTFEGGDAERFAREAAAGGAELVIAAGGDGTVNGVANGLHAAHRAGVGELPRVAIVPLGTANDLANALGIPEEVEAALRLAVEGEARAVDLGIVGERCFLNVSSGGIGAEATEETSSESKRALGALAYLVTGVRKFAALQPSHARFTDHEVIYDGPFLLFAVGNAWRTGGGNLLTPRADMADGLLDLCIVKECTRMEFLKLMPELRSGEHLENPAVIYRQVPCVRVEAAQALSVNADGEPQEGSVFVYRLAEERLRLVVP
jgi:diacylglycerol kinase (ATP)